MAKSLNQKGKILYLMKLFLEKTDEDHGLGMSEIIAELARYDIKAERKSIYDDIGILRDFGLDIRLVRGKRSEYKLVNRTFSLADIKLLVEIIQSTPYITTNKTKELTRKLYEQTSKYERREQQSVRVTNRIKNNAETPFIKVQKILEGIEQDKKISFRYFIWKVDLSKKEGEVKKTGREEARTIASPWAVFFHENIYYLAAVKDEAEEISLWNIHRMEQLSLENGNREGEDSFQQWEPGLYFDTRFGTDGGEVGELLFECHDAAIDKMVDFFGKEIKIQGRSTDSQKFLISAYAAVNNRFFGWLFSVANQVRLVGPEYAVEQFRRHLKDVRGVY